jgi:hypothetical protein
LADLEGGGVNGETERLFAYHHVTKHSLDWHNQPDPFRSYEGAPLITLPAEPGFPKASAFATMAALAPRTAKESSSDHREEVPARRELAQPAALAFHGDQAVAIACPGNFLPRAARESLIGKSAPHASGGMRAGSGKCAL